MAKKDTDVAQLGFSHEGTIDWYEQEIRGAMGKSLEGVFIAAERIEQAVSALGAKDFIALTEGRLNLSKSTVSKMISIHKDHRLVSARKQLPPSWSTVYEFTRMDDESLESAKNLGEIHPLITQKEATALVKKYTPVKESKPRRMKDETGRVVPERLTKQFEAAKVIRRARSQYERWRDEVADALEEAGVGTQMFLEMTGAVGIEIDENTPHRICECSDGCEFCGGKGWMNHEEATKEHF